MSPYNYNLCNMFSIKSSNYVLDSIQFSTNASTRCHFGPKAKAVKYLPCIDSSLFEREAERLGNF